MKNILVVEVSPRGSESISRQISASILAKLKSKYPDAVVVTEDLALHPLPHLDQAFITAMTTPHDRRTEDHRAALAPSQRAVEQLKSAETILISFPVFNFSIPSALKAWVVSSPLGRIRSGPGTERDVIGRTHCRSRRCRRPGPRAASARVPGPRRGCLLGRLPHGNGEGSATHGLSARADAPQRGGARRTGDPVGGSQRRAPLCGQLTGEPAGGACERAAGEVRLLDRATLPRSCAPREPHPQGRDRDPHAASDRSRGNGFSEGERCPRRASARQ